MRRKPRRKQPRRLTPPLILRDDEGGRECIEVDQELTSNRTLKSGRVSAFLILSSDLRVTLGSRCINKRRVPVINITALAAPIREAAPTEDLSLTEAVEFFAGAGMNVMTMGFTDDDQETPQPWKGGKHD